MSEDLLNKALGGDELPDELNKGIESKGGFYNHPVGEYTAFVGTVRPTYKDVNGKSCKADDEGAKVSGALCPCILVEQPEYGRLITDKLDLVSDVPYGARVHNQFMSLKPTAQWVSERFFGDFTLEGHDDKAVVQDKKVYIRNLRFFRGATIKFKMVKSDKTNTIYPSEVMLTDHKITNETLGKRNQIIDLLETKLADELEKEKEANKAKKGESSDNAFEQPSDMPDTDDLLGDLGGLPS
jgi:hypothetical protein